MATRSQFEHKDVARVPRGYKVRTVRQADGTEVRVAFPPGRRRKGSGKVVSILHPKKNARPEKEKTRQQVEAMQDKAVRFLRDVADKPDAADDIEDMSVEEYAAKKHIKIKNPARVLKSKRKHHMRKASRKNPDAPLREATDLYREFHGRSPSKVIEMQASDARRGTYSALGELAELHFKAPNRELIKLGFEGNHVKLASSPDGNQLYLIGGDQAMPEDLLKQFGVEGEKDFVDLGEAVSIVYVTRKRFDHFKVSAYVHKFGEEGGYRPEGFYNRLQRNIILAGGSYHIEAPGIIN